MRPPFPTEGQRVKRFQTQSIFPQPQDVSPLPGSIDLQTLGKLRTDDAKFRRIASLFYKRLGMDGGNTDEAPTLLLERAQTSHREEYVLETSPLKIFLSASSDEGLFRGLTSLCQLREGSGPGKTECLRIEDRPVIDGRGFMLDVSRCKVPTMKTLTELIDLLADLRYNELQLYVEHTFSFRDHEIVWKNASPLTGENIREIDQYCRERFIELVPNLNSFGHFERWLRHEPYKAMAECPDGFRREDPYMVRDHGTTLRPDADSLAFVDSLYTEYLPNFTSGKFNVGMDEPWELGQGWSKEDVSRKGKEKVYLEYLEGIRKLVEKHGKRMQFWADVLLEKPENASLLAPTAEPIIWGYEADHPFDAQSKGVASCGLNFRLAPGTGTWRSFTGRWPDARTNLESASENALKHGAEGILLTTWGDCGNHQPWCTLYPSLLYSAQLAWNGTRLDDPPLADAVNRMVFRSSHMNLGAAIMEAGRLDRQIGSRLPNRSLAWNLLFEERRDEVRRHLEKNQTARRMGDGIDFLSRIVEELSGRNSNHKESLAAEELLLGIELSSIALNKGLALLSGNPQKDPHDTPQILRKYEKAWLARARPGGLKESLSLLEGGLSES